jgi:hypothetical protein
MTSAVSTASAAIKRASDTMVIESPPSRTIARPMKGKL